MADVQDVQLCKASLHYSPATVGPRGLHPSAPKLCRSEPAFPRNADMGSMVSCHPSSPAKARAGPGA